MTFNYVPEVGKFFRDLFWTRGNQAVLLGYRPEAISSVLSGLGFSLQSGRNDVKTNFDKVRFLDLDYVLKVWKFFWRHIQTQHDQAVLLCCLVEVVKLNPKDFVI